MKNERTAGKAQQRGPNRWGGRAGDRTAAVGVPRGRPGMAPPHHQWVRSPARGTDAPERGRPLPVAPHASVTNNTAYGIDSGRRDCIQLRPLRVPSAAAWAAGMPQARPTRTAADPTYRSGWLAGVWGAATAMRCRGGQFASSHPPRRDTSCVQFEGPDQRRPTSAESACRSLASRRRRQKIR